MAENIQSTQDKYRRVPKNNEPPQICENEVRITTRGRVKKYVDYATRLMKGPSEREQKQQTGATDGSNEEENRQPSKKFDTIVLKATGKAINKAVTTAEVVKRTVGELHQETSLETLEIVDVWEPIEEGLQKVETTRRVASITIKLSRNVEDVDEKAPGYQKPIAQETGFPLTAGYQNRNPQGFYGGPRQGFRPRGRGFNRGRGRGFNRRGRGFNRGRGRGRGFRGGPNRGFGSPNRRFPNRGGGRRGGGGRGGRRYNDRY